ncbi:MAG: SUMF1/EgtB/PvdO family nonheme iron enzyme [Deltaproteobacteria bacterium]|nr:SUMF1/EgtB/PvdO family nonheme iron enzyme [Deltaproteobacteria bacterium]
MTTTRTMTIANMAILAACCMHGCGGKVVEDQEVIGAGGSGHDAAVGGTGGTGGSTAFDGCPGLGCAPNCGDAGIAVDKNGCPTCTCNAGPDGGTGGSGGTTGCGTTTCGSLEQCFNNKFCVAKLVPIAGGYSIDATEVTRAQYAAWLGTNPTTGGQLPACSWKAGVDAFKPRCVWPPATEGDHPVVCVDWCDADAYCKAVGKRLCGKIGGGSNGYDDYADATKSEWFNACSSNDVNDYPYGDTYDGQKCNGSDKSSSTVPVGSLTGCQSLIGGYAGVYDLSGNVFELEDSCTATTGQFDWCRVRGGAVIYDAPFLRCDYSNVLAFNRTTYAAWLGFRCCSDM